MSEERSPPAFQLDLAAHRAAAAFGAAWWTVTASVARRLTGHGSSKRSNASEAAKPPRSDPPPLGFVRHAWREAFEKDAKAVAQGLYPARGVGPGGLFRAILAAPDVIADARAVEARRRRGGNAEARDAANGNRAYPAYYAQNFHYQSGGWFTADSAGRYEAQVEMLFAGSAGPMRRCALALLARAWRGRDHRGLAVLDLACGAGGFLADLEASFPRARIVGLDLSAAYLAEAARRVGEGGLVQANAERLPMASASVDALSAIYLFHELPPKIRRAVAGEIARVLKPGGLLVFADALQPADEPRLARLLEVFPATFHEPFFATYAKEDLAALFAGVGLVCSQSDRAFLTKAMLFEKAGNATTRIRKGPSGQKLGPAS